MKIDQDSWEEWLAHPITEAVWKVCSAAQAQAREHWTASTFDRGSCDPIELTKLRTRASVFEEIRSLTPEKIEEVLG